MYKWQDLSKIKTVNDVNTVIKLGYSTTLINVGEAWQERQLAHIAYDISQKKDVRVVLIAGPSSSGKTTTCKRLSIQLVLNEIWPVELGLDDYFLDREQTPRDADGKYDFESLYALNLELFNQQLADLIAGKEVELPRYNFVTGKSEKSGEKMTLASNEVLVIEGIHALNPELTENIPQEQIFRIFAAPMIVYPLTADIELRPEDNRLLRRIIRDYKYRGNNAQATLSQWASVRAGEKKWILPYKKYANVVFNTSMPYEVGVIKNQAEPLLKGVPQDDTEYAKAQELLSFMTYFEKISENDVPKTSLLREFLGGSSFVY
ncbi:MAG: nucleoside kinase [Prevotella sp.]|nr:nucleoside kinase [Prevotella sp.]